MALHFRSNESVTTTAKWVAIGTAGYLLDWLTYKSSHTPYQHELGILFYWVMPVLVGFPTVWLDSKIAQRTSRLKFHYAVLIRSSVFAAVALLAASVVFLTGHDILHGHSGGWLIFKFITFWLPTSLAVLMVRNLLKHFDQKTILEWVVGTYHLPSEEERIFLFVDIKDSTAIAESLGNKKYFEFIQEFRHLASDAIRNNQGEVYQYVGDEIVITWPLKIGIRDNNAVKLFFQLEETLAKHSSMFIERFGRPLTIKGALHAGKVTRGEIGKSKKEFGYVGDVINTTARIQSVAKKTPGVSLVISERMNRYLTHLEDFNPSPLGNHALRGKNEQVFLYTLHVRQGEIRAMTGQLA